MSDYKDLIIMSYFFQFPDGYELSYLQEMMGFTNYQLEEKLLLLRESGLMEYRDYLLTLTPKGIQAVISKSMETFNFFPIEDKQIKQGDWPIDKIYVPKAFMRKYK